MELERPLRIKIQLYCGDEIAIGPGKADLLEAIDRKGSIAAAGRDLGLSYRRAWQLVDTMNRCWREPLVETKPGSARSGAQLSEAGRAVLADYRTMQKMVEQSARGASYAALSGRVRAIPRTTRPD